MHLNRLEYPAKQRLTLIGAELAHKLLRTHLKQISRSAGSATEISHGACGAFCQGIHADLPHPRKHWRLRINLSHRSLAHIPCPKSFLMQQLARIHVARLGDADLSFRHRAPSHTAAAQRFQLGADSSHRRHSVDYCHCSVILDTRERQTIRRTRSSRPEERLQRQA